MMPHPALVTNMIPLQDDSLIFFLCFKNEMLIVIEQKESMAQKVIPNNILGDSLEFSILTKSSSECPDGSSFVV